MSGGIALPIPIPNKKGRGRSQKTLGIIEASIEILKEIAPATVRGVCYKLFTLGMIKNMGVTETQKIGRILSRAREIGDVDWGMIVDETRRREQSPQWLNLEHFRESIVGQYRRNFWAHQPETVELWSEKGTVRGVLAPVLEEYGIVFSVKHGFDSATSVHDTAMQTQDMKRPLIALYVGDYDPSGLCMSVSDLPKRLREYGAKVDLRRIALTREDTLSGIPAFDAATKSKDGRYKWFVENYGERCWEIDALDPRVLREKVRQAISSLIDREAWDRCLELEKEEKARLLKLDWSGAFSVKRTNTQKPRPPRPLRRKCLGHPPSGLFRRGSKNNVETDCKRLIASGARR
jgi:hypothetical protein